MGNELLIYKTNSLIEASYRLTLDEIRVLALTIGTMNPKSDQQVFDFTVADFIAEFPDATTKNAYNQIQNAINRLYDRSVRTEDGERVTKFRWVSSQTYFKSEGRFRIALTNEVMPYLTQLKGQFTQYQLRHISSFKGVHSIRIYELCTQYKSRGDREITVEKLKEWLQVEDNYSRWGNFKMRVLDPAVKEINAKSDLLVSVELIKKGRAVHAIKFNIKSKKTAETADLKDTPKPNDVRKIYGVFAEIKRPQVAKGSQAEADWVTDNYNRAVKQMRADGILKTRFIDESLSDLPTEWLKVIKKYASVINRGLSREISDELHKRKDLDNRA